MKTQFVSPEVVDAIYKHFPGDVQARLIVDRRGVLQIATEEECKLHARRLELLAGMEDLRKELDLLEGRV